jgi:hypothetical protein
LLVFADNDILIKLAGCALLDHFFDALERPAICIAPAARYSLPKQAKKQIQNSQSVKTLCEWIARLPAATPVQDAALLDRLSEIQGIDSGEALLFAAFFESPQPTQLITGDRRALRGLLAHQAQLHSLNERLQGAVYTLESAILLLIAHYGFAEINEILHARSIKDKVIDQAFGPGRDLTHARSCLSAYTREVLPFLVNADHLVAD